MRTAVTGLIVQATVTSYTDDNKVAGHVLSQDGKPPMFSVAEADIPEPVLEWVRKMVGMKGE